MSIDMNGLTADVSTHGTQTVVALAGEIDLSNHVALRTALNDLIVGGSVDLVLDLTDVTFMDSTGLGAMIGTRRRVHAFQGSLAIVLTNDAILRVFEVTGLDKVFDLYDSRAAALRKPDTNLSQA
ncbi:STAS domain-containing protein [Nocardioides iriomotensis]|uniref:Anti-sigma factor antagonist n=1 Tax=Nocardioides iriomotensis TaxID=715784 RepID=A0A4Q5ITY0_9ACTN|nr:STAS domain-containing protein [Nocardioides iriomotensis]RYU09270.1 anti-sigma factor antagonist [Nocardioides iriomotensis]